MRKPLQGVKNIIRFNWHFYFLALVLIVVIILSRGSFTGTFRIITDILVCLAIVSILTSLMVSAYIYDFSNLYQLPWLANLLKERHELIVNINAGFDETSMLIQQKFKDSPLWVYDFYDPVKHSEVSIKRARKAYPPFANTIHVNTACLPLPNNSADLILLIFAAHEIRDGQERISFFRELHRTLQPDGRLIVTEHLRDTPNFFAYNIGVFHFYSKASWLKTFFEAQLSVETEVKTTPFISTFILYKSGTAS